MSENSDETDLQTLAVALVNYALEVPDGWSDTRISRRLSWRPSHSDLIFNYVGCAIRCDKPADDRPASDAPETATALECLSSVLKIEPLDVAYHFVGRV